MIYYQPFYAYFYGEEFLGFNNLINYLQPLKRGLNRIKSYNDQRIDSEFLVKVADYFCVSIDKMLNRSLKEKRYNDQIKSEFDIRTALEYILKNYNV